MGRTIGREWASTSWVDCITYSIGCSTGWVEGTTVREGSPSNWEGSAIGWAESTTGWQGSAAGWVGNSASGKDGGARGTGASTVACAAELCSWRGPTSYSRGPPGAEGQWAQDRWEGSLVQRSREWVLAAGWVAKQEAIGEEIRWGVPSEGVVAKGSCIGGRL